MHLGGPTRRDEVFLECLVGRDEGITLSFDPRHPERRLTGRCFRGCELVVDDDDDEEPPSQV